MDKFLRPERFDVLPGNTSAEWNHWYQTFCNFIDSIEELKPDKLKTLVNYVSPRVYKYITDAKTYDEAITQLRNMYVKSKSEISARHILVTRRQQPGESLDDYVQTLRLVAKDCNFKAVTAEQHCEESIRDAFITGLASSIIRQRLLENSALPLQIAIDQA